MADESLLPQSDDSYERIVFHALANSVEVDGTVGWREGQENRVVFSVWEGPSFAAIGSDLHEAVGNACAGIKALGYVPIIAGAGNRVPADPHELFRPVKLAETGLLENATDMSGGVFQKEFSGLQPVLWVLVATILLALMLPVFAHAEIPVPGKNVAFPNAPYFWRYEGPDFNSRIGNTDAALHLREEGIDPDSLTPRIVILHNDNLEIIASYELQGGSFCDFEDDNCELDGFFPIVLASAAKEPVIAAVTHVGVHGQKLSVFRPLRDSAKPVFDVVADYALILKIMPEGLMVDLEMEGKDGQISRDHKMWIAGNAGECSQLQDERLPAPPPPTQEAATLENELRRIARERSLADFTALLADDVLVSFGGEGGLQEFLSMLDRGHEINGEAEFWKTLDRLLAAGGWSESDKGQSGGGDNQQTVTWPWFFAAWPQGDDGMDAYLAGPDLVLRAGPDDNSPILAKLPFSVLRLAAPDSASDAGSEIVNWHAFGWLPVAVPGHCLAYVRAQDAAPLNGTRMIARRDGGKWLIEAFVSGD